MDKTAWSTWRKARNGARKAALLAQLMADNDKLVQQCAAQYVLDSRYDLSGLQEDILQAMRIGLLLSIQRWDPAKGQFSTLAYLNMRHEAKKVRRHATPISMGWRAYLPRSKQEEARRFENIHGRPPSPDELRVSDIADARQRQAAEVPLPVFTGMKAAESIASLPDIEETIDHDRKTKVLREFLNTLTVEEVKAFWAGKRLDLVQIATEYVAQRCEETEDD